LRILKDGKTYSRQTIYHPDGKRRVDIIHRQDGMFGFEEWKFSAAERENCWIPEKKDTATLTDSFDRALYEAQGRIAWMKELESPPVA